VTGDLTDPIDSLVKLLQGIDTVICSIFPPNIPDQIPLVNASVLAGVKRFVPCNWAIPCARGLHFLRDMKETVHDHIFRERLGYTIIDVGFWYENSFPLVPSGKFNYANFFPGNTVVAGGTAKNMLMHRKDVGRFTVRVIKDERTLNKRVFGYAELLSQNEKNAVVEEKTGEKLELKHVSSLQFQASVIMFFYICLLILNS
jgi:hypothetical protein